MEIEVQIKSVYGQPKVYPVCDKAKLFARLVGQATLTDMTIKSIKELGYKVNVTPAHPATL